MEAGNYSAAPPITKTHCAVFETLHLRSVISDKFAIYIDSSSTSCRQLDIFLGSKTDQSVEKLWANPLVELSLHLRKDIDSNDIKKVTDAFRRKYIWLLSTKILTM